jgi:hypothetical protein
MDSHNSAFHNTQNPPMQLLTLHNATRQTSQHASTSLLVVWTTTLKLCVVFPTCLNNRSTPQGFLMAMMQLHAFVGVLSIKA